MTAVHRNAAPIELAFRIFLLSCQTDRQLSPHTITWYRKMLTPLVEALHGTDIRDITAAMVREYIADLQARPSRYTSSESRRPQKRGGLSPSTVGGHIRAVRAFFHWCQREYSLPGNPASTLRPPRQRRAEPKAISLPDLKQLLAAAATVNSPLARRDLAMMAFLADTGCRSAGLLGLQMADLHLIERMAVVREKGDRARAVPFTGYTVEALQRWLEVRPKGATTVFCALSSDGYGKPLTHSGLRTALLRWADVAGVKGRVNAHSFRHGFARAYLENGGDLATLAQLMGHSSVEVTVAFYAVFTDAELSRFHAQFTPLKSLEEGRKHKKK